MDLSHAKLFFSRLSPPARIVIGMFAGAVVGLAFGPSVASLGAVGKVVIGLIKMLATPLIFFVVLDSMLHSSLKAKSGLRILGISVVNGLLALIIALTLANALRPGRFLEPPKSTESQSLPVVRPMRFLDDMLGMIPTNLVDPFLNNSIIAVVMFAVCLGVRAPGTPHKSTESLRTTVT
jgi:Na+/H+-dicarboxylate symporter